ncbi:histidine kinase dimerization/phospho-acceptor domain-containing protein [Paenibacillus tarimensis]|uniref:histidine kinase dimerization/phospho-acceptor domain-containing protein n=1 Tax=Paenibacillus tarimensis TaxID=416012 RepID=UPI001F287B74|nr:histidine kinase dimerization/phospho-acceptor domain-containing protein [Paenibacillus tarimensis]MCF2944417.1 HAMP domain-containing histidine kinase [Paenibacillus tarimensis]
MDTRWKNKALLAAWLLLFTFGMSGVLTLFSDGSTYIRKSYFDTPEFQAELDRFIDYLSLYELSTLSKEELKQQITVSQEEIEEHRYRYGDLSEQVASIKQQYAGQIEEARASGDDEVAAFYKAERDRKIQDITKNFQSDDHVRAKIVKEKEQRIDQQYREFESMKSEFAQDLAALTYYFTETETGKVFTNTTVEERADKGLEPKHMLFVQRYQSLRIEGRSFWYGVSSELAELISASRKGRVFAGEVGVPKAGSETGYVLQNYYAYQTKQTAFYIYTIMGAAAFAYSIIVYRRRKYSYVEAAGLEKLEPFYRQIPVDIRAIVLVLLGLLTGTLLLSADSNFYRDDAYGILTESLTHLVVCTVFVSLILVQGIWLKREFSSWPEVSSAWRRAFSHKVYQKLKEVFLVRSIALQWIIMMAVVFIMGLGFAVLMIEPEPEVFIIYILMLLSIGLPILVAMVRRIGYFNEIVHQSSLMAAGDYQQDLPVKGRSALAKLAGNINILKGGIRLSQKEQAKSERLKTELITNVSHDLRTPLTSIITYTKLLKKGDLSEEDRTAFVEILDRKSQRLKVLIDDLFEATKMASGHIELVRERVDLVQLLEQALAEYEEAINASALQFRTSVPDTPVMAIVDGQKLWRVFDNLIGNCLKYSLDNTRVYISMKNMGGQAVITFKNVAKYELSENIDELFERFKRGDASRHTEGSGLGLAIAKSIMDLHDAQMDIDVDGDLFKVTVTVDLEGR